MSSEAHAPPARRASPRLLLTKLHAPGESRPRRSRGPRAPPTAHRVRGRPAHARPPRGQPRPGRTRAARVGPCRHGPAHVHFIIGDVIGFALRWDAQEHGALWISGDTVLYDGVREVAGRVQVDTALLHLGAVRFPVTGPVRYTMTAREAVELSSLIRPRQIIPVHYEGWKHFSEGRAAIERAFANVPQDLRASVRWVPLGERVALTPRS